MLVTGGTGFIASWCIVELLEAGHDVVASVRAPEREREVRAAVGASDDARLSFAVADLTTDTGWDEAANGCERGVDSRSLSSVGGSTSRARGAS